MPTDEYGITEKLPEVSNVKDSGTSQEACHSSEENAKNSESTLQYIKRSVFGNPSDLRQPVKKKKASASLQNVLGYELMYEDGICDLGDGRYSITIGFDDITYQSASKKVQEHLFIKYCEMLEYFSSDVSIQITINNRIISEDTLKHTAFIPVPGNDYDYLVNERNSIIAQQSVNSDCNVVSDKYITITIKADSYEQAHRVLLRLVNDTQQNLKSFDCTSEQLSGLARLTTIHSFFNSDEVFNFKYINLLYSSLTTKDYVIPESLDFKKSKSFSFNDKCACVLYVKDYPTSINDRFIKDITSINCQMSVNLHLNSLDKEDALTIVDSQTSKMETRKQDIYQKAAKRREMPIIPRELQLRIDEADSLRKAIDGAGMKMFKATIIVTVVADSPTQLKDCCERVKGIARQHGCNIVIATALQKEGLNSSLLLGNNQLSSYVTRTLTSASAGIFIPFTSQELFHSGGQYYGINRESHNAICFDRRTFQNPNAVILATSGAGKSFRSKREAIDIILSSNDQVIFIDPEREYGNLTDLFNGQTIRLGLSSENHINPFEINENYAGDEKENPVAFKSDFVTSMIQQIVGSRQGLSDIALSIVDRCVNLIYQPFFTTNPKKRKAPTFVDLWNTLKAQPEQEAKDLAVALERFVTGNMNVFAHEGNVDLNNRIVCLDTRDLGKQLKSLGMMIAIDFIWNRITENREKGITTWIYVDEFHLYFQDERVANFFAELWKRARKWNAIMTGITQNVEEMLVTDAGRAILSTSEIAILLNNSTTNLQELARLYELSDMQLKYITNSAQGQGLIRAGKIRIPFDDKVPKDTNIYKAITTKPGEM